MDLMMTEQFLEQTEVVEHMRGLPHAIKLVVTGPQKRHPRGWQGTDLQDKRTIIGAVD